MLAKMSYQKVKELLNDKNYPLAILDLDALDKNYEIFARVAIEQRKKIRIASKSLRLPFLLRYLQEKNRGLISGIMCYRIKEAEYLFGLGFKDLLIAYPEVSRQNLDLLAKITKNGAKATIIVDSAEHLELLEECGKRHDVVLGIVIELDGSLRIFDGKVNLGVRRSPIHNLDALAKILQLLKEKKNIQLTGLMLYEAQVAGLADESPWNRLQNPFKKRIKKISIPRAEEFRTQAVELLKKEGFSPEIINGGGSGSIFSSVQDKTLTEVTVGSGFVCSHLFSYYHGLPLTPALFFAIQAVRKPDDEHITCCGGGFIASGSMGMDRLPEVFLPQGIKPTSLEGFGEVQTPFRIMDQKIRVNTGDPIILRHAKAGELAEHFNAYYLLRNNELIGEEKTYRGLGFNFL